MKSDRSEFWSNAGFGICIFAFFIGFGGCCALTSHNDKTPIIAITINQSK